jgi:hypothetical protein
MGKARLYDLSVFSMTVLEVLVCASSRLFASVLAGNDVAERTVESLKQGFVATLLQLVAIRLISNQIPSSAWTPRTGRSIFISVPCYSKIQ